MVAWLLFLLSFGVLLGAAVLLTFGVLWSPVAALLCGIGARKRRMSTLRYTVAGAFYSMLFVVPSVYLLFRLNDANIPQGLVRLVYIIIYTAWVFGPICLLASLFLMSLNPTPIPSGGETTLIGWISFAFSIVNILALLKSYHDLNHPHPWSNPVDDDGQNIEEEMFPDRRYILPFVYPIVLTMVFLIVINIPALIMKHSVF